MGIHRIRTARGAQHQAQNPGHRVREIDDRRAAKEKRNRRLALSAAPDLCDNTRGRDKRRPRIRESLRQADHRAVTPFELTD